MYQFSKFVIFTQPWFKTMTFNTGNQTALLAIEPPYMWAPANWGANWNNVIYIIHGWKWSPANIAGTKLSILYRRRIPRKCEFRPIGLASSWNRWKTAEVRFQLSFLRLYYSYVLIWVLCSKDIYGHIRMGFELTTCLSHTFWLLGISVNITTRVNPRNRGNLSSLEYQYC